jgi:hypothetical protein
MILIVPDRQRPFKKSATTTPNGQLSFGLFPEIHIAPTLKFEADPFSFIKQIIRCSVRIADKCKAPLPSTSCHSALRVATRTAGIRLNADVESVAMVHSIRIAALCESKSFFGNVATHGKESCYGSDH